METKRIKTDVLVIGGGIAGWFAADKARAQGASVTLVDKGYVGKAGQSPFANGFIVFRADWGDDLESWLAESAKVGEYMHRRNWTRAMLLNSYDRYRDLESWGIEFEKNADGTLLRKEPEPGNGIKCCTIRGSARRNNGLPFTQTFGYQARKHLLDIGVTIMDNVMMIEFLKQDDRIVGGVGLCTLSETEYVIEAKTTVSCVGAAGYKPSGYPMLGSLTGDGEAMAYRAGAELNGKEFIQPMYTIADAPGMVGRRGLPAELDYSLGIVTGATSQENWSQFDGQPFHQHDGRHTEYHFAYLDLDLETHAGKGPISCRADDGTIHQIVSGAALGMGLRKTDGLWPANDQCGSTLPGLYAAGDALATMQDGAIYLLGGGAMAGCAVTGAIAGENAGKEAIALKAPAVDEAEVTRALEFVNAPAKCTGGYSPEWVIQLLRNTMMPYFIYVVKKADRLEAALTYVMFMKDHLVPKLIARDVHELRMAHEAANMVLNAEMRLRSALFRTESRGMHYREDHPNRDDENWLVWTKIRKDGDTMVLEKVPIPEEWHPDMSIPYAERYTYRFPGEKI